MNRLREKEGQILILTLQKFLIKICHIPVFLLQTLTKQKQ